MTNSTSSHGHGAPSADGQRHNAPAGATFFDGVRRVGLVRTNDRWVAGVCGGIAQRTGVDVALVRAAWVILACFAGFGFFLYAVAWALLPEEHDGRIHLQEAFRGNFDIAMVGIGVLAVVPGPWSVGIFGWLRPSEGWAAGVFNAVVGVGVLVAIGAIIAFVVTASKDGSKTTGATAPRYRWSDPEPSQQAWSDGPGGGSDAVSADASPTAPTTPAAQAAAPVGSTDWTAAQAATPAGSTDWTAAPAGSMDWTATPGLGQGSQAAAGADHYQPGAPPTTPTRQKPPKTASAGATLTAMFSGLAFLAAALVLLAARGGLVDGNVALTAVGIGVAILGIGVVVAGILGRTSGALGGLAIVAALVAGPTAIANDWRLPGSEVTVASAQNYRPASVADITNGFVVVMGQSTLDFTGLTASELAAAGGRSTVTVPVRSVMASTTVLVPADVPIRINTTTIMGSTTRDGRQEDSATRDTDTYSTEAVSTADPILIIDVHGVMSDVTITEVSR